MPIPPVTEFEGQLPNEGEPASFPARAEALFDWLVGLGMPEFNAAVAAINAALNDNGTVLDTAGKAIALTTNAGTLVETAGTGNAYTITPAVAIPAYEDGQTFMIRPNRPNTGAVTLKVGDRAVVPVRKVNTDGTAFSELVENDWRPGEIHIVGYRGGQFELLSVPLNRFVRTDAVQTITAAWTFNGNLAFGAPSQVRTALGLLALATRNTVGSAQIDDGAVTTLELAAGERMTSANVLAATAAAVPGAVGTYAVCRRTSPTTADFGTLVLGSSLAYASASGNGGGTPSGTWMTMGRTFSGGSEESTSLFLRVS